MAQNRSSCVVSRSPEIPIGIIHKDIIYTIDVWSKTHTHYGGLQTNAFSLV